MNNEPWVEVDQKLYKQFVFKDFPEALSWMLKAAFVIEKLNHHPEWSNVYNKVNVYLTTHDAGNTITQKDRDLAKALDLV
ncbi:MAG: pterin-4-alpha-carbinolamine dehydratase [Bacteroidetes bacterium]|jgi:4a-hydroxytetrahydrobiopterin dehydratase|nr:pterin-4-alpha-carbinolamine dehydratase [Bacteroidota bacterium]